MENSDYSRITAKRELSPCTIAFYALLIMIAGIILAVMVTHIATQVIGGIIAVVSFIVWLIFMVGCSQN